MKQQRKDKNPQNARSSLQEFLFRKKTYLTILSCMVVFVTTYLLILPAVTLDKDEAVKQGGIDVPAQAEQMEQEEQTEQAEQEEQTDIAESDDSETAQEQSIETETEAQPAEQPDVLSYDGKGYAVTADASGAGLPEGTQLVAEEISKDDESFNDLYQEALKAYQKESKSKTESLAFAKFYNISLLSDGEIVEPDDTVDVTISYKKALNVSDADTLRIVHFGEKKTEIIDPDEVVLDSKKGRLQETSFTAESFSVYGVITVPAPQGADDLDGRTLKISRGSRYLMAETGDIGSNGDGATGFLKGSESDAPVWQFEQVNGSVYHIFTMAGGQKKYMHLAAHSGTNRADASLSDNPQDFTVETTQGGYRLSAQIGNTRYYLDEHNDTGGNGFAGWGGQTGNGVLTFHFTQPTAQNDKEYMVVVKQGDDYYIVQNDGTLTSAKYNREDNTVAVDDPMMWKYDGQRLYHVTREAGFNGDDIASDSYYRYIDPSETSGLNEDNENNTDRTVNGRDVHINTRNLWDSVKLHYTSDHKLQSASNAAYYIGVSGQSHLQLKGQVSEEDAVEVFLADPLVNESNWTKHTVNHIDISINGTAEADVPLAYGKYYDKDGNVVKEVPQNAFEKLHLTGAQVVDANDLTITPADMKRAHISATCNGKTLDNAFYITGYTGNAQHSGQTGEQTEYATSPQVRIEGSFLVANMPENHATIDTSLYDTNRDYRNDIREEHLANKVEYSVSVVKEIQFYLQMPVLDEEGNPTKDDQGNPVYQQLYDADGKPLTIRADVSFSDSFNYWDEDNECPVFTDTNRWYYYKNYGPSTGWNADDRESGDIARCNFSGMDFKLGGGGSQSNARVYAIEITKIVVDENGNRIKSDDIGSTKFNIYRKQVETIPTASDRTGTQYQDVVAPSADEAKDLNVGAFSDDPYATDSGYQLLREKDVQVGSDGFGLVYDYDVDPALYYVEEDPDSVAGSITDNTGKEWKYKQSYVWTEYAWRNCDNDNRMHTGKVYDEVPAQGGYKGVPEILGNHYGYNGTDGPYTNDFLEFYVYNVYESPKVDVPVEKTWPDFDGEGKENYDWTATFKLQWAPLYPDEETPTENFTDFTPEKTITITKSQMQDAESQEASLADRTFKDLPKYGTDRNGNTFRYQYSLEETAYQVTDKTTGVILYSWSDTEGYNTDDEDTHYHPFYPHDAGETVDSNTDEQNEADANYYIQVRNAKRNIRDRETIDVSLEKQWDMDDNDMLDNREDDYYAEFELRRFVHTEYRDISHMSDSDRTADPVTVTIQDSEGHVIDSLQVQPNVGVYLAGNFKPHDDAKSVTFTTETPVRMPNDSHATSITATAAGSNQSNALVRSGEFFVTHDTVFTLTSGAENLIEDGKIARVLDTSAGASPLPDKSFRRPIRLDNTNNWKTDLEKLVRSETSAGDDDGNENVTYYEYYLVEKESKPGGFARYFRADENGNPTGVLSGDSDHQIEANDQIVAVNGPTNRLVVKKKWRGTPDTTGFPGVTFTLYQSKDQNGNDKRIYTDDSGTEYKKIELKGNSLEWICPVDLPATYIDNNGTSQKYYYFVQEDEQSGSYENGEGQNTIRVGWEFYYYLSSCLDVNGEEKTKQTNAYNQPYQAAIEGGDIQRNGGTITICNRLNRYTDLDIKKQFFTLLESGSWDNSTSAMTSNVVLGFKVIRAIKLPDGTYLDERGNESAEPVWMDFSEEMLCGYDANGNPVLDNSGNDFYLKYFGLWHFEIMNNWGDQTNVNAADSGSSMPTYGFYIKNGEDVVVEYEYSFRETNVYKDLDRTPYPEWDWFSSVTPVNGYGPGKTPFETFPKVFHGQDPERIANFQASDLIIHKQWIGDITADEVYVKLWRTDGSGAPEDFTAVIAEDVKSNHNWQMYVNDESSIDTRHGWLILKDDGSGNWTDTLKVNRALLGTLAETGKYHYYIQEVAYKTPDGQIRTNVNPKYKPLYDKWEGSADSGGWTNAPVGMNNFANNAITIGAKGENQLKVINRSTPSTSYSVTKAFTGAQNATGGQSSVVGRYPTDGSEQVVVELQQRYRYEQEKAGDTYLLIGGGDPTDPDDSHWKKLSDCSEEEVAAAWLVDWQGAESADPVSVTLPRPKPAGSVLSNEQWYGSAAAWSYTWEGLDLVKTLAEDSDPTKTRKAQLYYRAVETSTPAWMSQTIASEDQDGHKAVDDDNQTTAQILSESNAVTNVQERTTLNLNKEWTGLGQGKTWPRGYVVEYQLVQNYHLAKTDVAGEEPEYSYGRTFKSVDMVKNSQEGAASDMVHPQAASTLEESNHNLKITGLPLYGFFTATAEDVEQAAGKGVSLTEGTTYAVIYTYSVRETAVKKNGQDVAFRPQNVNAVTESGDAVGGIDRSGEENRDPLMATLTNELVDVTVEKEWNGLTPGANESATIGLYRFEKPPEATTFTYTVAVTGNADALASDGSVTAVIYDESGTEVDSVILNHDNNWSHEFALDIGGTYHAEFTGDGTVLKTEVTATGTTENITAESSAELTATVKPATPTTRSITVVINYLGHGNDLNGVWFNLYNSWWNGQNEDGNLNNNKTVSGDKMTAKVTGVSTTRDYGIQIGGLQNFYSMVQNSPGYNFRSNGNDQILLDTGTGTEDITITLELAGVVDQGSTSVSFDVQNGIAIEGPWPEPWADLNSVPVGRTTDLRMNIKNINPDNVVVSVTGAADYRAWCSNNWGDGGGEWHITVTPESADTPVTITIRNQNTRTLARRTLMSSLMSNALSEIFRAPATIEWHNDALTLPEGADPQTDTLVDTVTFSGSTWSKTWEELPKYSEDGKEYVYYAYETDYTGAQGATSMATSYRVSADGELIVTNTPTYSDRGNLKVTKEVLYGDQRDDDADGLTFTVGLFADEAGQTRAKDSKGQDIADQTITVSDGTGEVIFTDLPEGTYYVYEIADDDPVTESGGKATISGTDYTVTYTGNQAAVSNGNTAEAQITNKKDPLDLEIVKIEAGKPAVNLPGAEFTIYQLEVNPDTQEIGHVTGSEATYTTGDNGQATIQDLVKGYYEIKETKSPAGYILNGTDTFYIKVTGTGISLVIPEEGKLPDAWSTANSIEGFVTFNAESSAYTATVSNTPGAALPNSGGPGTTWIYLLGSLLLIGSGILLAARRRVSH